MEHATPAEPFTPHAAAEAIREFAAYEEPLRRRGEGVTWMVWGAATLGAFLSMPGAETAFGWPWMTVVLLAWIVAGFALSKGVWTLAATAAPRVKPTFRRTALAAAVVAAVWFVGMSVGEVFWPSEDGGSPGGFGLMMLGTVWAVVGVTQARPTTPVGRRVLIAIGALMAVVGLAYLLLEPRALVGETYGVFLMGAPAGGIPFVAGLWQVLRG